MTGSKSSRKLNQNEEIPVRDRVLKSKNSLFVQKWALTIFDEAHELRTEGALNLAAHALRTRSGSLLLCTATPLYTGEKVRASLSVWCGWGC